MFETILFDIDGVMLSEERYFDASALTVLELLHSPQYAGLPAYAGPGFAVPMPEEDIRRARRQVFADDIVLRMMKDRGVNANWDMVYLQTAHQLLRVLKAWAERAGRDAVAAAVREAAHNGWDAAALRAIGQLATPYVTDGTIDYASYAKAYADCRSKAELFSALEAALTELVPGATPFDHERKLWLVGQQAFQEWYLGDAYVAETKQPGKPGFLTDEVPIVDPGAFADLLQRLKSRGVRVGIATGRPEIETRVPLTEMGWWTWFDPVCITTASDVLAAEMARPEAAPLSKPHPYSYLRSYLRSPAPEVVLAHTLPLPREEGDKVLIVGDSVADGLAARKMGCRFAAVLTGLDGAAARPQFEQLGSDYILEHVLELPRVLGW
ncbi:HAD family hydrolase [Alicyclobacillus cellulosilyticus]|nr:HAD family hydrolase [Alicyclobacillus cellulosilyticus]